MTHNLISELIRVGGSKSENPIGNEEFFLFLKCWIQIATMTNIGESYF